MKRGDKDDINGNDFDDDDDGANQSQNRSNKGTSGKKDSVGLQGLFAAVSSNDYKGVKAAVKEKGADVNGVDDYGWTPLRKAARNGNLEITMYLLDEGASCTESDMSVIITASSWGRTEVLSTLLDAKGVVSGHRTWEISPLVVAAQNGHLGVIKVLCEADADLNQCDTVGNDALMTAWHYGRAPIVRYLVENGACLKKQEDWERLAQSPATALNIADGSAAHMAKVKKLVEMGEKVSDKMQVDVPMNALCAWIRMVPQAALVLLDKVLMHPPDEAPQRATVPKNALMNTAYLDVDNWRPKEEPNLLVLAPKDMGNGNACMINVIYQRGILNTQVFFALASARRQIFKSVVVTAMLQHAWDYMIESRYRLDIIIELFTLLSLVIWTVFDSHMIPRYISLGFVILSVLTDILEEVRQLHYHKAKGESYYSNILSSTGASIFRCFRILVSLILIAMVVVLEFEAQSKEVHYSVHEYKIVISVVIITRWFRLLSYFYGYAAIGPFVLPILKCTSNMAYWGLVALVCFFAFTHTMGPLMLEFNEISQAFLTMFYIVALQKYEMSSLFGRWLHFSENYSFFQPEKTNEVFFIVQTIWFLVVSFLVGVVLFNILIAIISDSFDIEQQQAWICFLEERTDIAFTYFLAMDKVGYSPMEMFSQGVLRSEKSSSTKLLWLCATVDEETFEYKALDELMWSGRLGKLALFVQTTVNERQDELCNRLDSFEESLKRKIQTFNSLLKNVKKEVLSTI